MSSHATTSPYSGSSGVFSSQTVTGNTVDSHYMHLSDKREQRIFTLKKNIFTLTV